MQRFLGIACAFALLALTTSAGRGYGDAGCGGNPALSVPLVTAVAASGLVRAQASIVVSDASHVLTQWTWVKDAQRILVTPPGEAPIPARPLGVSEARDLVLLELPSSARLCPVAFGDVARVHVSQPVRVYGYPFAGSPRLEFVTSETGRITAIQGPPVQAFRADMVVGPGFAGGPVTNMDGKVIGVQRITAPGVLRAAWSDSALGLSVLIERLRRHPPMAPPTRSVRPSPSMKRRSPTDRQIKIAVHVSLSGPSATIGRSILDGAAQAVAEQSAAFHAHGFQLLVVPLDDRGDSSTAVANARKYLLDDPSVVLVIGHNKSGVCQDAARVYEHSALPMITPACEVATVSDEGWRTMFRVIARDDVQGVVAARFARTALRARTAYVAYEPDDNYALRTAAAFWWEGGHLGIHVAGLTPADPDMLGEVAVAAAGAKPDVVYYGGGASGAAQFLKELRSLGTRAAFLGPDSLDSSEFAYFAGPGAAGAMYTILDGPLRFYEGSGPFVERFKARVGHEAGPFAALGYDAARIGLQAIVRATTGYRHLPTREEVLAVLHDPSLMVRGVTGAIRFTPNGDRDGSPVFVMQVRGPDWASWPGNRLVTTITP